MRALGPTAPIRAAYEFSKRAGGHQLVFGRLATTGDARPHRVFAIPSTIPTTSEGRLLADADAILAGSASIFGRQVPLDLGWHSAPDTGGSWARVPWWRIDIRSDDRVADVKWTWELGRHRHLLVLARACWLKSDDDRYADALTQHLRTWLSDNPPEHGVHWYSNLEISLRALTWLQILGLAGGRLPDDVTAEMHRHLLHSGRHLIADSIYTVSSMRNNHMLGDALGLIALGTAFDRPRWRSFGESMFRRQLARHMRSDGSMIEDSLSYHRFVTEMLAVRVLLGGETAQARQALASSGRYLARLGAFDGSLPQYGDWDEGRVLGSSGSPQDVAGVTALALALTGTGADDETRAAYDECAWYAPEGAPLAAPPAETDGASVGGGFSRAVRGDWHAWLKAGGGTSHQHADLCSTVLRIGEQWVVGDPGTGTYNGPLEQRNGFRTSSAHSVLRLRDEDQLGPHRAFRWLHAAQGTIGPPVRVGDAVVTWGVHDAYARLDGVRRVVRVVMLTDDSMTVADVAEVTAPIDWQLTLPLHPDVTYADGTIELPDGSKLALDLPGEVGTVRGQADPFEGWWSDTYGEMQPTTWIRTRAIATGPVVWSVRRPSSAQCAPLADGIRVADTELRVSFTQKAVHLRVRGADVDDVLTVETAR